MSQAQETWKVKGSELLAQIQRLLNEGNVRRIVIKQGTRTVAEFPLAVGVVGALGAPALAAIGALAALLTDCTLHVERRTDAAPATATRRRAPRAAKKAPRR
jgi:hypothetical protein